MKRFRSKSVHPIEFRTFPGKSGRTYLVFKSPGKHAYFHVFAEVEAKQAARDCRSPYKSVVHTQVHWRFLWNRLSTSENS